ncbi:MAG TPA: hypothetical protein VHY08_17190 [Bacillota bacterium]|nr:hypothetical protein [Bacillota bacterium]
MPPKQPQSHPILYRLVFIVFILNVGAHLLTYLNLNLQTFYPFSVLLLAAACICIIAIHFTDNKYINGRTINIVRFYIEKSIPVYLKIASIIVLIYVLLNFLFCLNQLGGTNKVIETRIWTGFALYLGFLGLLLLYQPPEGKNFTF